MAFERKMLTVRSIALALSFLVTFECWTTVASASVRTVANETGIALSIEGDGSFEITSRVPAWQFSGNVGSVIVLSSFSRFVIGPNPSGCRSGAFAIPQDRQNRVKRCGALAHQLD